MSITGTLTRITITGAWHALNSSANPFLPAPLSLPPGEPGGGFQFLIFSLHFFPFSPAPSPLSLLPVEESIRSERRGAWNVTSCRRLYLFLLCLWDMCANSAKYSSLFTRRSDLTECILLGRGLRPGPKLGCADGPVNPRRTKQPPCLTCHPVVNKAVNPSLQAQIRPETSAAFPCT